MMISFRLKLCRLILWDVIKNERQSRDYGVILLCWGKKRNAALLAHKIRDAAPAVRKEIDAEVIQIEWRLI